MELNTWVCLPKFGNVCIIFILYSHFHQQILEGFCEEGKYHTRFHAQKKTLLLGEKFRLFETRESSSKVTLDSLREK